MFWPHTPTLCFNQTRSLQFQVKSIFVGWWVPLANPIFGVFPLCSLLVSPKLGDKNVNVYVVLTRNMMIKVRFILWPKTRHWWTESRWFPRVRQRRCCRIRALIMTMTQMSCCQLLVCVMFQSMSVHHTKTVGLQRFEVVFFWTSYRIQSSKVYIIDIGHRRGKKIWLPKEKSMKYQCWSGGEHQPSGILLMMVSCLCQLETTCNHSRSSYLHPSGDQA